MTIKINNLLVLTLSCLMVACAYFPPKPADCHGDFKPINVARPANVAKPANVESKAQVAEPIPVFEPDSTLQVEEVPAPVPAVKPSNQIIQIE